MEQIPCSTQHNYFQFYKLTLLPKYYFNIQLNYKFDSTFDFSQFLTYYVKHYLQYFTCSRQIAPSVSYSFSTVLVCFISQHASRSDLLLNAIITCYFCTSACVRNSVV